MQVLLVLCISLASYVTLKAFIEKRRNLVENEVKLFFSSAVGGFLDMGAAVMGPVEVYIFIIVTPSLIIMTITTIMKTITTRSTTESNRGATSIKGSSSTTKSDTKCKHRGKTSSRS